MDIWKFIKADLKSYFFPVVFAWRHLAALIRWVARHGFGIGRRR